MDEILTQYRARLIKNQVSTLELAIFDIFIRERFYRGDPKIC